MSKYDAYTSGGIMSRADRYSLEALRAGRLIVDVDTGVITRPSGHRAEQLDKRTAYGRVWVSVRPAIFAMAHRIVWLAAYGHIPLGLQINHINRKRWDNRIANLEVVSHVGNARHAHGIVHDAVGGVGNVQVEWLGRFDRGEREPEAIDPYGRTQRMRGAYLLS